MPAILQQGRTAIRDQMKTLVTHIGLSDDQTAFSDGQTDLSPGGGSPEELIKTSSESNVDGDTFDAQISVDGDSEFTNATIWTISLMNGATTADVLSRTVRTQGIGVQAGDSFTIGVRVTVSDETP